MAELIYKDEVYAIIGAAMEVYNTLRPGFAEPVYQEAFGIEMLRRRIPVKPQQELFIFYKDVRLQKTYIADYVAYEKIIIEIKALDQLGTREEAQLLNYLKATGSPLGLLINFGAVGDLDWKRMAATEYRLRTNYRPKKISED
ncbi:MAG: GxxExxY protein [Chloroflexi bacterium]|nr:MAG: GxxExxY protein [Chloroflexota bacterium]